jgi:hypothetical protein
MDRFDRRDPKIHFRDLAQLRQTGTAEAFISEFQRVAVAVTNSLLISAKTPSSESNVKDPSLSFQLLRKSSLLI